MARFSCGFRPASAGDTTHPLASVYATAAVRPYLVEVGVWNTTATAVSIELVRLTTAGTQGAAQTEVYEDDSSQTAVTTVVGPHTGTAPTAGGVLRVADLGAAIGSGVIWTFGGRGASIPNTTGDGIGVMCLSGTSQVCDVYFVWDE